MSWEDRFQRCTTAILGTQLGFIDQILPADHQNNLYKLTRHTSKLIITLFVGRFN